MSNEVKIEIVCEGEGQDRWHYNIKQPEWLSGQKLIAVLGDSYSSHKECVAEARRFVRAHFQGDVQPDILLENVSLRG